MDLRERNANPNRHPWELSRADMALQLLSANARDTTYVDIGSGDLYFARRLCDLTDAPVYAVDVHYANAGAEAQLVICTDLAQVPSGSVDCAVLMDVLEHVDDDAGLLRAVGRVLTPGGHLLITVPAHALLWSDHDVFLEHRRRYNLRNLRGALQRGGLDIVECFYFYGLPCLARAFRVGLSRLGVRQTHSNTVARWPYPSQHPITRLLRAMLNCDFRLSRLLGSSPLSGCGLSICAICRRTSA
jgi:SAM-dependent methyltransferase